MKKWLLLIFGQLAAWWEAGAATRLAHPRPASLELRRAAPSRGQEGAFGGSVGAPLFTPGRILVNMRRSVGIAVVIMMGVGSSPVLGVGRPGLALH